MLNPHCCAAPCDKASDADVSPFRVARQQHKAWALTLPATDDFRICTEEGSCEAGESGSCSSDVSSVHA